MVTYRFVGHRTESDLTRLDTIRLDNPCCPKTHLCTPHYNLLEVQDSACMAAALAECLVQVFRWAGLIRMGLSDDC